ncbi:MAG: DUF4253 domain-containing protein [Anaerolineae bacterium]|nr:DUF4253 domain-containing protein [Anaerolineae bacterium]
MKLDSTIINQVNHILEITGQPYQKYEPMGWVETDCYKWGNRTSLQDLSKSIPPKLKEAFQRFYSSMQHKIESDPQKMLDEFFAKEPVDTQTAYANYLKLQKDMTETTLPTPPDLTPSLQLQQASERVLKLLSQENFRINGTFDMEAYLQQSDELMNAEYPELQEERRMLSQKLFDYQQQIQSKSYQKKVTLEKVRKLLDGKMVVAYRTGIEWEGTSSAEYETIVLVPSEDQFDVLRIEQTQGNNHPLSNEELILFLEQLDQKYGVDITGATRDGLEFYLKNIPQGEDARSLGQELLSICPDLGEASVNFPTGKVCLWWD